MDTLHDFLHNLINHFVPHEGNDYRPHLLQKTAMVGMFVLVILSFVISNFQALLWQGSDWLVGAVLPAVVVNLTNSERQDIKLSPLVRNEILDKAATLKAQDMAKFGYFAHESPEGVTPWHWFKEAGYTFSYAGENLAVYFTDSSAVVDAWMNSPTHRANIVGSDYREIGVGTAKGTYNGYDTVFVVQLFGTPAVPLKIPDTVSLSSATPAPLVPAVVSEVADDTDVIKEVTANQLVEATLPNDKAVPEVAGESVMNDELPADEVQAAVVVENNIDESVPADNPVADFNFDNYAALSSDLMATTSGLAPDVTLVQSGNYEPLSPVLELSVEPNLVLQYIYLVLGSLVTFALLTSVLLSWRQHRPMQTVYGLLLLLIISGLFYLHVVLTGGVVLA